MWSTRDGEVGPTPAGPILRWHSHVVCKQGKKRGLKPPPSGKCPAGSRLTQGASEMLHVWFTHDLRSAFAISAPRPGRAPPAFSRGAPAGEVERFLSGRTNRGPCNGESARVLRPSGGWPGSGGGRRLDCPPRTRRHSRDEIHSHRAAPRGRGRVPPGELCAGGKGATRGLESCARPEAPNLPFRPRARRHAPRAP